MMHEESGDGRLNWLDWLILLGLLGAVIGLALWVLLGSRHTEERRQIEYTLCISGVRPEDFAFSGASDVLIASGLSVRSGNGTVLLGEVLDIRREPAHEVRVENGAVVVAESTDRENLYVRVLADATVREGDGFRVGDVRIAAADTGDFRLGGYLARGVRVASVREVR